jgi:hypothetical protein
MLYIEKGQVLRVVQVIIDHHVESGETSAQSSSGNETTLGKGP